MQNCISGNSCRNPFKQKLILLLSLLHFGGFPPFFVRTKMPLLRKPTSLSLNPRKTLSSISNNRSIYLFLLSNNLRTNVIKQNVKTHQAQVSSFIQSKYYIVLQISRLSKLHNFEAITLLIFF